MKIKIIAMGKFKKDLFLKNSEFEIIVDLVYMHDNDITLSEMITNHFEALNELGCNCILNENDNHCDCEGYGYEYDYTILSINPIE